MDSEWIEGLHASRANRLRLEELRKAVRSDELRRFSSEDTNRQCLPVVIVETKGKGEREYLKRVVRAYADVGKVGTFSAIAMLYDETSSFREIRRFEIRADRVLVIRKYDKKPFLRPWELADNEKRLNERIEKEKGKKTK